MIDVQGPIDPAVAAPALPDVLVLDKVSKHYRSGDSIVTALGDISIRLAPGEVAALLGPSGSGKSTLLLIAGLLEPPSEGQVLINGQLVGGPGVQAEGLRDFRRKHIGFVFQKANLIPFLSARENVQVAMEVNDISGAEARDRALELLNYLDVGHRANNLPKQLSGGEQQRVAVARAIANQPALILADEPTAALDAKRGRQVFELFRRIAHERRTAVICVTHDHRSLDVFDRLIQLEDGHMVTPTVQIGARPAV